MACSKAKLKNNGDKTFLVSDNSEKEMHPTDFNQCGLFYRFGLNTV
jgi:hypothetical protein